METSPPRVCICYPNTNSFFAPCTENSIVLRVRTRAQQSSNRLAICRKELDAIQQLHTIAWKLIGIV